MQSHDDDNDDQESTHTGKLFLLLKLIGGFERVIFSIQKELSFRF